jgi:hypothetical protein
MTGALVGLRANVPCPPVDRVDDAAAVGIGPTDCHN